MAKQLLRKLNSKKYRAKREREIIARAASVHELAANARAGRKAGLIHYLTGKMPDWDESDMQVVVSLLAEHLPGHGGRKKGSVTKNRKPKDSDQLIAIAVAVATAKDHDPKVNVDDLSEKLLQEAMLHDPDTNNQTTILNWVTKKSRTELMKRAASAGLLPRN